MPMEHFAHNITRAAADASSVGKRRQTGFEESDDASPPYFGTSDSIKCQATFG